MIDSRSKYEGKGFTLIELLAVIVILEVIALIVTPVITNIIDESKKNSALRSVEGYLSAVINSSINSVVNSESKISSTGLYTVNQLKDKVSFKGDGPTEGFVILYKNIITSCSLKQVNYIINCKDNNSSPIIVADENISGVLSPNLEKGTPIYFNLEDKSICNDYIELNSTTGAKSGCMKWCLYKDNQNSTYQLILDHIQLLQ